MEIRLRGLDGIPAQVVGMRCFVSAFVEIPPQAYRQGGRVDANQAEGNEQGGGPAEDLSGGFHGLVGEGGEPRYLRQLVGGEHHFLRPAGPFGGQQGTDAVQLEIVIRSVEGMRDEKLAAAILPGIPVVFQFSAPDIQSAHMEGNGQVLLATGYDAVAVRTIGKCGGPVVLMYGELAAGAFQRQVQFRTGKLLQSFDIGNLDAFDRIHNLQGLHVVKFLVIAIQRQHPRCVPLS